MSGYAARDTIGLTIAVLQDLWPAHDGPGHIVYADCNLRNSDIEGCLGEIEAGRTYSDHYPNAAHPIFVATAALLRHLLNVPEEARLAFAASGDFYSYEWS